ncbi:MAG: hypothetical protein ACI9RU_003087 [Litorivivens sp.]|jgi:hypothetical protein
MLDIEYGICLLPSVPCRKEGADSAEMVSQLLYGELYTVIEKEEKWILIRSLLDNYDAFICQKQFFSISPEEFQKLSTSNRKVIVNSQEPFRPFDGAHLIMPGGSIEIPGKLAQQEGFVSSLSANGDELLKMAQQYKGAPYLWGGKTTLGIDCSGFMQVIYRAIGVHLPRDAWQQASQGEAVNFIEECITGDMAFFDNDKGRITHVGMIMKEEGELKIIHASGWVRVDTLDHQGIFAADRQGYSHKLRTLRRLLPE